MTNHPRHPDQLPRTKWSTVGDEHSFRHWEVEAVHSDGTVTLRATLDRGCTSRFPWRELRDRERWVPGWS